MSTDTARPAAAPARTGSGPGDEPPVRWLDDRQQHAWRALLHMHARLNAQLGRELQDESGLSNADFTVLVSLSDHPEQQLRILELARELQWEKSRLSHQLRRMQQRGLLDRSDCSEDRRGAFVVLTAAGRAALDAAAPRHVAAVRRYLFDHLDEREVATLADIADGVLARLGDAGGAAGCADAPDGPDGCCSSGDEDL